MLKKKLLLIPIIIFLISTIFCNKQQVEKGQPFSIQGYITTVGNLPFQEKVLVSNDQAKYFFRPDIAKTHKLLSGKNIHITGTYKTVVLETADKKIKIERRIITEIKNIEYL